MNQENPKTWEEMLLKYKFAKTILEAQLQILLKEHEHKTGKNCVEHTKSRLKTESSILKKLESKGYAKTVENVEKHIHDIVGFRIVCSFLSDVKEIVKMIENSEQITVHDKEDYISNPKETGYSSYHLNVYVPVYLIDGVTMVAAEIQIRTVAMDFWASLDHKITYKFKGGIPLEIQEEMQKCADDIRKLDRKMLNINNQMQEIKDDQEII